MPDLPWISSKVCAAALDVTPKTLRNYAKQGCPHEKRKGSYVFQELAVKAWMKEKGYTGETGWPKGNKQTGTLASGEPIDPKERKLFWDAKAARVRAMKLEGTVLDADEVRTANMRKISAVKQGLLSLPSRVAGRLAHRNQREIEVELTDEVRLLLTEFAEGKFQGE